MNTPDKQYSSDNSGVAKERQRRNPLTPEMVDTLFTVAFNSGVFATMRDEIYTYRVREEMEVPINSLKTLLEDSEYLDDGSIVQLLTDAFINAQQFVFSDNSSEYLQETGMTKYKNVKALILNDLQKVLTHLAIRLGVENLFLANISASGVVPDQVRHDTVPYGQKTSSDGSGNRARPPVLSFSIMPEESAPFLPSQTQDFPAFNIEDALKKAGRKTTQQGMAAVQMPQLRHSSSNPPERTTLPPPPMASGPIDVQVESLDKGKEAAKFFKPLFVDFVRGQMLKKLRDLNKSYTEAGKKEEEFTIFKDGFRAICRKAYSMVGTDETRKKEEISFHEYIDSRTANGEKWETVIEKIAEKIMAAEAMKVMSQYLPVVTRALLASEHYKTAILELDPSDKEKYEKAVKNAAISVCLYIKEQLLKPQTGEKLRDLAFLSFYFNEDREDLNLTLYNEAQKLTEEMFAEIRNADMRDDSEEIFSSQEVEYTSSSVDDLEPIDDIEPMPTTIRGLGIEPIKESPQSMDAEIEMAVPDEKEAQELIELFAEDYEEDEVESRAMTPAPDANEEVTTTYAVIPTVKHNDPTHSIMIEGKEPENVISGTIEEGDEDDDTDVFVVGGRRKVFPKKVMPAAGTPADKGVEAKPVTERLEFESYRKVLRTISDRPKVEPVDIALDTDNAVEEHTVSNGDTPAPLSEFTNQKVNNEAAESWLSKLKKSKAAKIAAGVAFAATTVLASYGVLNYASKNSSNDTTETTAASSVSTANNKPEVKVASNERTEHLENTDNETSSVNKSPAVESENMYTVHLDRIAGDDARLKTLVEEESFVRHPGNRGDFEQLHSIIAQSGAMTDNQIRNIQDNLNEKFNRGEYGAATRRFRPLLENGTLFEVLRTPSHPEHQALKAAIEKFGNPSRWTWTRKKLVKVDGKPEFKSMPYEEMYAQDVEFYDKCQAEFAQVGIGKSGNIHINGGKAGERIPLKINGRWLTFVETALQIRGIVERNGTGGTDVPAPPANLLDNQPNQQNLPAHDVPADNVPTNISPNGSGVDGGTYGIFDAPTIEMGEPVLIRKAELEDDPEIDFGEAKGADLREIEMAEIDAGWGPDESANQDVSLPASADRYSANDNELAEIDNEWGNIIEAIDKRVEQVKRAA